MKRMMPFYIGNYGMFTKKVFGSSHQVRVHIFNWQTYIKTIGIIFIAKDLLVNYVINILELDRIALSLIELN